MNKSWVMVLQSRMNEVGDLGKDYHIGFKHQEDKPAIDGLRQRLNENRNQEKRSQLARDHCFLLLHPSWKPESLLHFSIGTSFSEERRHREKQIQLKFEHQTLSTWTLNSRIARNSRLLSLDLAFKATAPASVRLRPTRLSANGKLGKFEGAKSPFSNWQNRSLLWQ